MDFTILAVVLLIGVGVPARNKLIRKYRDKKMDCPRSDDQTGYRAGRRVDRRDKVSSTTITKK